MGVDVYEYLVGHNLTDPAFVHDNLAAHFCACNGSIANAVVLTPPRPMNQDLGDACFICGGLTQLTGTCRTCTSCGSTTGCG